MRGSHVWTGTGARGLHPTPAGPCGSSQASGPWTPPGQLSPPARWGEAPSFRLVGSWGSGCPCMAVHTLVPVGQPCSPRGSVGVPTPHSPHTCTLHPCPPPLGLSKMELAEGAHGDRGQARRLPAPPLCPPLHMATCSPSQPRAPCGPHPPGNATAPRLVNAGATDTAKPQPPARSPASACGWGQAAPLPQGPAVPAPSLGPNVGTGQQGAPGSPEPACQLGPSSACAGVKRPSPHPPKPQGTCVPGHPGPG